MRLPRYQFTLRTFLIGCAFAGVITSLAISRYLAHDRWLHSISQVSTRGGFTGSTITHDSVALTRYLDHKGRPASYILFVYDLTTPNVPATRRQYEYSLTHGGILKVDDHLVDPLEGPCLFVNGAYGYTVRLPLNSSEVQSLESLWTTLGTNVQPQLAYWQTEIEPRLYKLSGNHIGGLRDGNWTYELWDGRLYLQSQYSQGQRHGEWLNYYPNGALQCRRHFESGLPIGRWEYLAANGSLLGTVEWERPGIPKRKPGAQQIAGGWTSNLNLRSEWGTSCMFSERDGGTFYVDGIETQRPPLEFPLQRDAE